MSSLEELLDPEEEERLTADSYGSLETTHVSEDCWMIRVPPKLAQAWEAMPEGSDLGELVFVKGGDSTQNNNNKTTKPRMQVVVAEHVAENLKQISSNTKKHGHTKTPIVPLSHALPLDYSIQAMTKKVPLLHPFTRNGVTGRVELWGTVSRTGNLQVQQLHDEQYRALLKDRLVATSIQNHRYVKPVEATESVMGKKTTTTDTSSSATGATTSQKAGFGNAVLQFGKRRLEATETRNALGRSAAQGTSNSTKKARQFAPDQSLRSVLFELFHQQRYWSVKDLKAAAVAGGQSAAGTRKGESEMREILREIGEYHRSGDHKNLWELQSHLQQQG